MAGISKQRIEFGNGGNRIFAFEAGAGIAQNTWYDTGYTKNGQFQHAGAFILINFSNQDGDANNLSGIARAPSSASYTSGVAGTTWTSISGSTLVEAKWELDSGTTYKIQVRTTSAAANSNNEVLHGMIFISDF